MNTRQQELAATTDDDALELFVRSPPEELEASALQLVAGGTGSCICPNGGS
ncbi:MAG TPA: hypothetical protein VIT38_05055 [Allosphingosinicella sp.]|jgi:hypothetical protein